MGSTGIKLNTGIAVGVSFPYESCIEVYGLRVATLPSRFADLILAHLSLSDLHRKHPQSNYLFIQ